MTCLFVFLRLFADSAMFLSLGAGIITIFVKGISDMTLVAAAVGLGGAVAELLSKKGALRYLGILPMLLPLFGLRGVCDWLLAAPVVAYGAFCVIRGALAPDRSELFYRFKLWMAGAVIAGIAAIGFNIEWAFPCALFAMAAEVFLLRLLRHDPAELRDAKLIAMELGLLVGVALVCFLLTRKAALSAFAWCMKQVWSYLVGPILLLIAYILYLVLRAVSVLFSGLDGELPMQNMSQGMGDTMQEFEQVVAPEGSDFLLILIRVIGAILFLLAAFLVLRALIMRAVKQQKIETGIEKRSKAVPDIETPDPLAPPRIFDRRPSSRIRRSYAGFLRTVDRRVQPVKPSDTTRSVNEMTELTEDDSALELRELYIRARYGEAGSLTSKDAQRASALAKQLRDAVGSSGK